MKTAASNFIDEVNSITPSDFLVTMTELSSKRVHIDQIAADTPGTGLGTRFVGKVVKLADKHGVTLSLEVETYWDDEESNEDSFLDIENDSSAMRLLNWYEKFGFETDSAGDYGIVMIRKPNTNLREFISLIIENEINSLETGNQYWYHTTSEKNLERIKKEGLKINPGIVGKSYESLNWMKDVYGMIPVFLSKNPGHYKRGVVLKINTKGLPLVADVPSLTDWGAQLVEDGDRLFFDEEDTPEELWDYVDPSTGEILYSDLVNPNNPATKAVIELTDTVAVMENIEPWRIEVTDLIVEKTKI